MSFSPIAVFITLVCIAGIVALGIYIIGQVNKK